MLGEHGGLQSVIDTSLPEVQPIVCAIFSGFALPRTELRKGCGSAVKDRTKGSGFWFCCDTVEDLHGECRLSLAGEANVKTVLKVIVILMVLGALSMLASTRLDGP